MKLFIHGALSGCLLLTKSLVQRHVGDYRINAFEKERLYENFRDESMKREESFLTQCYQALLLDIEIGGYYFASIKRISEGSIRIKLGTLACLTTLKQETCGVS